MGNSATPRPQMAQNQKFPPSFSGHCAGQLMAAARPNMRPTMFQMPQNQQNFNAPETSQPGTYTKAQFKVQISSHGIASIQGYLKYSKCTWNLHVWNPNLSEIWTFVCCVFRHIRCLKCLDFRHFCVMSEIRTLCFGFQTLPEIGAKGSVLRHMFKSLNLILNETQSS